MTSFIADDALAIKTRLDQLQKEKDEARARRAEDDSFEKSPFSPPITDHSDAFTY